jgi:hypothetical protein
LMRSWQSTWAVLSVGFLSPMPFIPLLWGPWIKTCHPEIDLVAETAPMERQGTKWHFLRYKTKGFLLSSGLHHHHQLSPRHKKAIQPIILASASQTFGTPLLHRHYGCYHESHLRVDHR